MIATVGSAEADILADFKNRQRRDYTYAAIISFLLLGFSVAMAMLLLMYKRHVEQVKEREAQYRSFFENSLDAILLTIPGGRVFAANPAATEVFGMSEEELCRQTRSDIMDVTDPAVIKLVEERLKTGKAKGELTFKRKDGSTFHGEVTSAIYQDASGHDRCTMMIRDITERKRLQQQLLEEQNRYQLNVTKQVISAQEREREVIGRELHDNVNQVLTTVKLYLEMALTDKESRERLLPKSIQYVMDSINEIRKLSQDLSAPTLGTRSLVDSITALLEAVQSSSGLRIAFRHHTYQTSLPMEQKLALYRIIQEQLNNIIKHAKASKVLINIVQSAEGIILSIRDNGQGFDTTKQRNGIGINNIISRAQVFRGTVIIDSEIGKGCNLTVTLPSISPT
jgi:PAS domain S-box-containing protein